jgi:RHS repeat-associated protein
VYDFENHLIRHGDITVVYDGDGNCVAETAAGVTTQYLVDTEHPTGYAQVMDEIEVTDEFPLGRVARTYTWGLTLIAQNLRTGPKDAPVWLMSYYGFDGHGSVRFLTDSSGAITDTYDYDAFGNLITQTGTTSNNYLFAGEQYDPALGLYYNRARYLDVRTRRFWGMDTDEGDDDEALTLHKYLYVGANPVNGIDPLGLCLRSNTECGNAVQDEIFKDFLQQYPNGMTNSSISSVLGKRIPSWLGGGLLPDLIDTGLDYGFWGVVGQIYEIKSVYSVPLGVTQVQLYLQALNRFDKSRKWIAGVSYVPKKSVIALRTGQVAFIERPFPEIVSYCRLNETELVLVMAAAFAGLLLSVGVAQTLAVYGAA